MFRTAFASWSDEQEQNPMPQPADPRQTEAPREGSQPTGPADVAVAAAYAEARAYLERAKAPGTLRAYRADWRHFAAWCGARGREVLPAAPDTLALYLTELARDHHVSTLTRRLAAVASAHHGAGYESPGGAPGIRTLMAGIRRVKGTAPATQKKPLLVADLERIVAALPESCWAAAMPRCCW
jgi:hypothetical protein